MSKFLGDDDKRYVVPLGADEGGQCDEDFLMFGSRDDTPASTIFTTWISRNLASVI